MRPVLLPLVLLFFLLLLLLLLSLLSWKHLETNSAISVFWLPISFFLVRILLCAKTANTTTARLNPQFLKLRYSDIPVLLKQVQLRNSIMFGQAQPWSFACPTWKPTRFFPVTFKPMSSALTNEFRFGAASTIVELINQPNPAWLTCILCIFWGFVDVAACHAASGFSFPILAAPGTIPTRSTCCWLSRWALDAWFEVLGVCKNNRKLSGFDWIKLWQVHSTSIMGIRQQRTSWLVLTHGYCFDWQWYSQNWNGIENRSREKKFGIGAQLPSHFKSLGIGFIVFRQQFCTCLHSPTVSLSLHTCLSILSLFGWP